MKCIYCLKDLPKSSFIKREHVIPQCYGTFTPDNLILYDTVCDDCNQYFGDEIELYLGRDTIEGIVRYMHCIRPKKAPKKHARLKFKIPMSELKGIIVMPKYSGVPGENDIEPVLQAGFFKKDKEEYDYFEPKDIPTSKRLIEMGYEIKEKKIPLIAKDDKEMDSLLMILKEQGMEIKPVEDLEWPEYVKKKNQTLVEGIIKIDRIIYRGFAKITFNYLAYIAGKDFVLLDDFNGIRDFIRYDKGNSNDYFGVNEPPILHDDRILKKYNIRTTNGHLIVVEWKGTSLIGKLSIFNITTYLIKFCRNFKEIWRPIKSGHHFDVDSHEINDLIAINSRLLI